MAHLPWHCSRERDTGTAYCSMTLHAQLSRNDSTLVNPKKAVLGQTSGQSPWIDQIVTQRQVDPSIADSVVACSSPDCSTMSFAGFALPLTDSAHLSTRAYWERAPDFVARTHLSSHFCWVVQTSGPSQNLSKGRFVHRGTMFRTQSKQAQQVCSKT